MNTTTTNTTTTASVDFLGRPAREAGYFDLGGAALIAKINADDAGAAAEARFRGSRKVAAALAAYNERKASRPVQAPAKTARERTPEQELRAQAWQMRQDTRGTEDAVTYREACALLGVTPARQAA